MANLGRAPDVANLVWTYCDFRAASPNGCGPGAGPVGWATGFINGAAISQYAFDGDPYLASTRRNPEVVVYTNIGSSNWISANQYDMVVAAFSWDSGVTFSDVGTPTQYVNEGACNEGKQDQQAVTFDLDGVPPPLARAYVVWRHKQAGTYGGCIRAADVDPVGHVITWLGPPNVIQNMTVELGYGIGGAIVQAGGAGTSNRVTVVYSNSDHFYTCPSGGTQNMAWVAVSSDDWGQTWGPSVVIRATNLFEPCLANNSMVNRNRTFGFLRDAAGDYYAALPVSKKVIDVFRSTNRGDTWTRIARFNENTVGSRFWPTLASDAAGRLGMHYYVTDKATDTRITPMFVGWRNAPMNDHDPETAVGLTFLSQVPQLPCSPSTNDCRTLGDYIGMAAKPRTGEMQKTYLPAWTKFVGASQVGNEQPFATRVRMD